MFGIKRLKKEVNRLDRKVDFLVKEMDRMLYQQKHTYRDMMMPTGYGIDEVPFRDVFGEVMHKLGASISTRRVTFADEVKGK